MSYRDFIEFFSALISLGFITNVIWLALLAWPFSWLWNWTLVSLVHAPMIDYRHALGVLSLWFVLRLTGDGIKLSAKFRD